MPLSRILRGNCHRLWCTLSLWRIFRQFLLCSWRILRQMSHFVLVKNIEAAVMLCSCEEYWGNCHALFLWRILRQLPYSFLVKNTEATVMLCPCEESWGNCHDSFLWRILRLLILCAGEESGSTCLTLFLWRILWQSLFLQRTSFCHIFLSCDIYYNINVIIIWDFIAGILYVHIVFSFLLSLPAISVIFNEEFLL